MKRLEEYLDLLKEKDLLRGGENFESTAENSGDNFDALKRNVEFITYNSKEAGKGTLFICKGKAFKKEYLEEAVGKGAFCYITEEPLSHALKEKGAFEILVTDVRKAMAYIAGCYYDKPWEHLNLTAVTGTKGKSTTVYFLKAICDAFERERGGKESGLISSIETYDGVIREVSHITTPESVELIRHLGNAVKSGIKFCNMEASSQALKYDRTLGVKFNVGIFLNISEDHISPMEHEDFDDYFRSKLKIFSQTECAIINLDSDNCRELVEYSESCAERITFSLKDENADLYGYNIKRSGMGMSFSLRINKDYIKGTKIPKLGDSDYEINLGMTGSFNVENALAAIGAALAMGIPMDAVKSGLSRAKAAGRMELYPSSDEKLIALVDYAHNKLSFEKLLSSLRREYEGYEIFIVFGCPGLKALNRRKDLAVLAGRYCDRVYLTAEDPNTEPTRKISEDIASNIPKGSCDIIIIDDRQEALEKALLDGADSNKPVLVVATGKGDEETQKVDGKYVYYKSDSKICKEFIDDYNEKLN